MPKKYRKLKLGGLWQGGNKPTTCGGKRGRSKSTTRRLDKLGVVIVPGMRRPRPNEVEYGLNYVFVDGVRLRERLFLSL